LYLQKRLENVQNTKTMKVLDSIIQAILIMFTAFLALSGLAAGHTPYLGMVGLFFLGGLQLLSSLLRYLASFKLFYGLYFLAALAYCFFLAIELNGLMDLVVPEGLHDLAEHVFLMIIPATAAICYFVVTVKTIKTTTVRANTFAADLV
jgi:hypothetical protein